MLVVGRGVWDGFFDSAIMTEPAHATLTRPSRFAAAELCHQAPIGVVVLTSVAVVDPDLCHSFPKCDNSAHISLLSEHLIFRLRGVGVHVGSRRGFSPAPTTPQALRMHRMSFIRQIAETPENSLQWHALTLTYRALALVDLLSMEAKHVDTSSTAALRDDARSLGDEDAIVSRVAIIAALLHTRRNDCWSEVTITLLELGELFQRSCLSGLALEVSLLALRVSAHDDALAWRAHRVAGWAQRSLGQFDEAAIHYAACIEMGQRLDSVESVFWGRNGFCLLAQDRGNLPRSEALFQRLITWTRKSNRPDLEAHARHGLGITLGLRGRLSDSLQQFEAALRTSTLSIDWGRILGNIGYTYAQLGKLEWARDVFLGLIASASEPYETFIAHINLIEVYAASGQRDEIEPIRRYLEVQPLPAAMSVDFQMTLGRAYAKLGDVVRARRCFERAEALAHRVGIGRGIIEADDALANLPHASRAGGFQNSEPKAFRPLGSREYQNTLPRLSRREQP